ncbi:hypothetical protein EU546_05785 [Candidatus Thorarchaeota archaeon]|nr:MAG: hypothetical protein EU546_05785 [Candidatus Thorarchaeota archaeon]
MNEQESVRIRLIDRENRRIELARNEVIHSYPLNAVPDNLKFAMADVFEGSLSPEDKLQRLYESSIMKPAVCTLNPGSPFPINTCTKIVRLSLTDDAIRDQIDFLEGELLSFQGRPFADTVDDRIQLYRDIYTEERDIDPFRLGAIEMYGEATYANILSDSRTTLSFQWRARDTGTACGYQLNCIAEVSPQNDLFFRFMRVLRGLFSSEFVDTKRGEYPCAYKFWISEVRDKSLVSKIGYASQ